MSDAGRLLLPRVVYRPDPLPSYAPPMMMKTSSSAPSLPSYSSASSHHGWGRRSKASEIGQGISKNSFLRDNFMKGSKGEKDGGETKMGIINSNNKRDSDFGRSVPREKEKAPMKERDSKDLMNVVTNNRKENVPHRKRRPENEDCDEGGDNSDNHEESKRSQNNSTKSSPSKSVPLGVILANKPRENLPALKPVRTMGNELSNNAEKKWKHIKREKMAADTQEKERREQEYHEKVEKGEQVFHDWLKESERKKRLQKEERDQFEKDYFTANQGVTQIRKLIAADMLTIKNVLQDVKALSPSKSKKHFTNEVLKLKKVFDDDIELIKLQLASAKMKSKEAQGEVYDTYQKAKQTVSEIVALVDNLRGKKKENEMRAAKRIEDNLPNYKKSVEESPLNGAIQSHSLEKPVMKRRDSFVNDAEEEELFRREVEAKKKKELAAKAAAVAAPTKQAVKTKAAVGHSISTVKKKEVGHTKAGGDAMGTREAFSADSVSYADAGIYSEDDYEESVDSEDLYGGSSGIKHAATGKGHGEKHHDNHNTKSLNDEGVDEVVDEDDDDVEAVQGEGESTENANLGGWWSGFKGTEGYEFDNLPPPEDDVFGVKVVAGGDGESDVDEVPDD
jgi:hypothetical protein